MVPLRSRIATAFIVVRFAARAPDSDSPSEQELFRNDRLLTLLDGNAARALDYLSARRNLPSTPHISDEPRIQRDMKLRLSFPNTSRQSAPRLSVFAATRTTTETKRTTPIKPTTTMSLTRSQTWIAMSRFHARLPAASLSSLSTVYGPGDPVPGSARALPTGPRPILECDSDATHFRLPNLVHLKTLVDLLVAMGGGPTAVTFAHTAALSY